MPDRYKTRASGTQSLKGVTLTQSLYERTAKKWDVFVYAGNYYPVTRRISESSSLSYQTGNDGSFRPCSHSITRYSVNPVSDTVLTWDYSLTKGSFNQYGTTLGFQRYVHQRYLNNFYVAVGNASTGAINSVSWGSLSQAALESMLPSLGGNNSYVNYVLELKDFRRLMNVLSSDIVTKLDKLAAFFGTSVKDKPLKKLAKANLMYQFGYKSLYNDLMGYFKTLISYQRRFATLVAMANTDLQAHFSTTVSGSSSAKTTSYFQNLVTGPGNPGGVCANYQVVTEACDGIKYHATLRYRYPLPPELAGVSGKLKSFLDILGVSLNPAIVWNAIPFSFIVDYFVNISNWLNRLRIDNIRFQTEIRDFCHSAKITRAVSYSQQFAYGYSDVSNNPIRSWTPWIASDVATNTAYQRKKGIPDFLTAFQVTGLNPYEFLIGGSLLGASSNKFRRKS